MHTRRGIVRKGAVLLAFAGLATAACAVDQALIDAAVKEGEVNWYTSLVVNQAVRPIAAAFEKEYPGVKVRVTSGTANDLLLKIMAESQANAVRSDVSHGGSAFGALLDAGLVAQYVPTESKRYPEQYKDPSGYGTGHYISFLVPAINTDLVKEKDEPKTWNDLLDPKWAGKIAWTQQMTQGGPPGFIGATLGGMGTDKGMDYLRKLSKQRIVNVPANQRVVLDQVISGQYPLALSTFSHHSELSIKKGAPVKWLKFEFVTGTVDPIFMVKNAPHPNASKLFIEFILSKKGQEIVRDADYIPADPNVPATIARLKPEGGGFKAVFLPLRQVNADLPKWVKTYNELFK
jgi:iron(III) transport system substrate-binding protein